MNKPILEIDGARFDDYAGFCREFSALLTDYEWRGNLDAFDDILYGDFGTPEEGFVLRWKNSDLSRIALGHAATAQWIEDKLAGCDPSWIETLKQDLEAARQGRGRTLFDEIVDIIRDHATGGLEPESVVELELL